MNTFKFVLFVILSTAHLFGAGAPDVSVTIDSNQIAIELPADTQTNSALVSRIIASRIKSELLTAMIREHGVAIASELLANCLDLYFADAGVSNEVAVALRNQFEARVKALRAVVLDGESYREAYDAYLKTFDEIDLREWTNWVATYNSKEKIDALEASIPKSVAEMKNQSKENVKRDCETILLFNRWSGVAANDVTRSAVNRKWKEEVQKHNIQIPEQYEQAVRAIVETPPAPVLPESVLEVLQTR